MLIFGFVFAFLGTFFLLYTFLTYLVEKQKPTERLTKYFNIQPNIRKKDNEYQNGFRAALEMISKVIKCLKFLDNIKLKLHKKMIEAHILLRPEEFLALRIILFFMSGFFGFALFNASDHFLAYSILFGAAGWYIPYFILVSKIKKRKRLLNQQLGDAVTLISNSLKAGFSFFQAVDTVSKEMIPPISEEFAVLLKEINLGISTDKALENLAERVNSSDLDLVVTAVLIQRQIGGNLSEVLDNISFTIIERIRIKGEIKTITAQGRMSGMVISLLPPGLGLILYLINNKHMSILFNDPLGIVVLVFSVFMELIGIFFIRKIVKIEV